VSATSVGNIHPGTTPSASLATAGIEVDLHDLSEVSMLFNIAGDNY
jgi:hypothetical protein